MTAITSIRILQKLEEMHEAVELQKTYWGMDLESVVPAHMLFSLATSGGHVLAAFDGDKMVAVLIGFLGTDVQELNGLRWQTSDCLQANDCATRISWAGCGLQIKEAPA